jgi:predicted acylesterase/phospholipase RssA
MLVALNDYRKHITAISCASVGGLNLLFYLQDQIDLMISTWSNIKRSDVMARRYWPLLPWRSSVYSSAPLRELIDKHIDIFKLRRSHIKAIVHAVECGSGKVRRVTQHSNRFADWVLAGASLPCVFEPVLIDGRWWQDGGIADNSPMGPLIDAGCDRIIVLHCHPNKASAPHRGKPPSVKKQAGMLLGQFMRAAQNPDLERLERINKLVRAGVSRNGHREIKLINIWPNMNVGTLEFDSEVATAALRHGEAVARAALKGLEW